MEIILGLAVIMLLLLVVVLAYIIRNLMTQISTYESWVIHFTNKVNSTWIEMKRLDDKNIFEKDDEVGVVFQQIKDTILDLHEKTQRYYEEEINEDQNSDNN